MPDTLLGTCVFSVRVNKVHPHGAYILLAGDRQEINKCQMVKSAIDYKG